MNKIDDLLGAAHALPKFTDPRITAKGETRASVALTRLDTLWLNTGTQCNITCAHCYIESSPTNDALSYLTLAETAPFLDEALAMGTREIGLTGGEPFLNPETPAIIEAALAQGFEVLVLTNAMRPMMRPKVQDALKALLQAYGEKLTLRISLDHYTAAHHDEERGVGSFKSALEGLKWLSSHGFQLDIAGRLRWGESEEETRAGFEKLFAAESLGIDARSPRHLMLFPEMDPSEDVPEITTECWSILGKDPKDVMCASSRMVVKRKDAAGPLVLPCTLLAYDPQFEMGPTLSAAQTASGGAIEEGAVRLNHRFCAKFCVLGGASCSA
ncbi:MAG: radical SAM protein [Alphaproteobacteria bacterium]|nr:MAG: radical SAM protein [Alphaproteobacteria bacterium]